ncbi:MAG: GNAT family N-acetyltransferase [Holosporaceae bacterium]|jgi:ribosomal protein S18 acetylase RimI-like enzyme|nr:GNAT family N-acetyltransferase [Holosporaceae bacterium]
MNITKLLDANMVGKFMYLPSLMRMDVTVDDNITVINSGISSDMFNIVCRTKNKKAWEVVFKKFRQLKMPFAHWVGFDVDYPQCKADMEEAGFVCDEHESAMFVEIEKLSRDKKCEDLQIVLVNNEKKLEDFIRIYRELISHDSDQIEKFYSKAADHILNTRAALKLFVGYFQNQPVATSALFVNENSAGVWDVVTLSDFRRKGIGTDMTAYALLYAFDNFGYHIGVLTASEEGEPVYEKIGFQKLKDFYVFNVGTL